jgi:ABC-type cobalamin/Fe3+-siderophores transport system ATPase subunit
MNTGISSPLVLGADQSRKGDTIAKRAHYSPPWADVSIIGVAGSSGSGKSTLSHAIVSKLNLPWVVILSMVRLIGGTSKVMLLKGGLGLLLQTLDSRPVKGSVSKRV